MWWVPYFYVRGDKRTVIDPSHSLRMAPYRLPHHGYRSFAAVQDDVLWSSLPWVQILHVRLWWRLTFPSLWRVFPKSSFRTGVRMLCGKNGKWNSATEWRIYYSHDALPLFPITVIDPSRSLRMAFFRSLSIRHYTGYVIIDTYKYMNKL